MSRTTLIKHLVSYVVLLAAFVFTIFVIVGV